MGCEVKSYCRNNKANIGLDTDILLEVTEFDKMLQRGSLFNPVASKCNVDTPSNDEFCNISQSHY